MPYLVNETPERYWVSNEDVAHLVKHGLIEPHEDTETGEEIADEHAISPDLLEEYPELKFPELIELIRYLELCEGKGKLSDWEALELMNFALSAPKWSASLLEDLAAIMRRTGRKQVPGATWASH